MAARGEELARFLRSKRWFGDKTREIVDATVRDVVPVVWPGTATDYAVARANVRTDAGPVTYQLFFDQKQGPLHDALEDPPFRRGLVDAFVGNARFEDGGVAWACRSETATPIVVPPHAEVTLSKTEQSNSSLIVGTQAILKLFRRLERGIHPDVEVTRFLTIERKFAHVPALLGSIRFEDADGETIAGMLQELVPGAVDGWTFALDRTRGYLSGKDESATLPFLEEARQLGVITRALHETLASGRAGGAFEARPVDANDLRIWESQVNAMIERATASLRRAPESARSHASAPVPSASALATRVAGWVEDVGADAGKKTRTHGDYHLGQVIRSASGQFFVIDFEGEPARPLEERRVHQSPLRDVAGMLRSLSYAAAVGAGGKRTDRAVEWEQRTRAAFLDGYLRDDATDTRHFLPRSRTSADRLIALFEMEKVFYELQYELDHRPDWVWIPLAGIARLAA